MIIRTFSWVDVISIIDSNHRIILDIEIIVIQKDPHSIFPALEKRIIKDTDIASHFHVQALPNCRMH